MKILISLFLLINLNLYSQIEKIYLTAKNEFEVRNFEKALLHFNKVISKNEKYQDALILRGLTYLYLQEFDSSLVDFNRYIEYHPNSADAYNNRGLVLGYLNLPDSARASFDIAVLLDPKFAQPLVNIAFIYENIFENDSALIYFDKALKLDKNLPEPYFQKGKLYHTKKMYKVARENFNQAALKGYKKDECFLNIGNIFFKEGNFKAAISEYSKVIKLNDKKTEAINNRAICYDTSGNKKLANKDRELLKKINKPFLVDFSKVEYKKFKNSLGTISLDLPKEWVMEEKNDSNSTQLVILPDAKNDSIQKYFAKVTLSIEKNMKARYNVFTPPQLIDFWKGSSNENSKGYKTYDVFYEKSKPYLDMSCIEFMTRFQINPDMPIIRQYEFTLFKDDVLFYGYFQCFEYQYQYFKKLFEHSLTTIDVKM